jgi:hypothetical protein
VKETLEKTAQTKKTDRPRYETPRIQVLTERDILNNFQITQSMAAWWTIPTC